MIRPGSGKKRWINVLLGILKEEFEIKDTDIYNIPGPLDLTMLMKVYGMEGLMNYKSPK